MTNIRDFIYIDVERLKSLYSQFFEGVVSTIVHTEVNTQEKEDAQKGGIRHSGSTFAERVAEASFKTESKFLYDHMYNLLEHEINHGIVESTKLSRECYTDALGKAFMVGYPTYVPNSQQTSSTTENQESNADNKSTEEQPPGQMRDAYRQIISAYSNVERAFTDSHEFVEIIVWPLAIYRETIISKMNEHTSAPTDL